MNTQRFVQWLDDVAAGEPLAVSLAIVLAAAVVGLLVLSIRISRQTDRVASKTKTFKRRWVENDDKLPHEQ